MKQQDGSEVILNKMRKRFLRQAFNKYKASCSKMKLEDRNEDSSASLKRNLDCRLVRKCFNKIRDFNNKNLTAKRYWKILLGKMDHWMKKRAFAMWMDGGNTMKMEMIMDEQNALNEESFSKNNELGGLTKKVADRSNRNAVLQSDLKRMGEKGMSNYFFRAYSNRL